MELQTLHFNDVNALADLQPDGWPDIRPHYTFYTQSSFCFPLKVIHNNKIVGIGTTIVHHDVAWLGHIIVHANSRGKGIGQQMTQALVDQAKQQNCDTIYLIATDLGAPVYEKAGFITETEYLFFKDVTFTNSSPQSPLIQQYNEEFREPIARIDKLNSGEDRLFHLDPFLAGGFVYVDGKTVEGFYLPTFGDGLIIANTAPAGINLLKLHSQLSRWITFPEANVTATAFLHENGFRELKTAKRMRFGKRRDVNLSGIYNRIGGNLG